ncbi:hypothetical protein [Nonomuraea sp. WAC 01424]|uniref:hypothetical protein n=1 Tax=Nonomuraea sp. WAC 01424 TaxID=2203200 RepID=UPI000F76EE52|nr:hypothetical protein [Nonomuraea sp. WAC 01424]
MRRLTAVVVAALAAGCALAAAAPASAAQGWVGLWSSDGGGSALENPAAGCHSVSSAVRAYNNTDTMVILFPEVDCKGAPFYLAPGDAGWIPFTAVSVYVLS